MDGGQKSICDVDTRFFGEVYEVFNQVTISLKSSVDTGRHPVFARLFSRTAIA